MSQKSPQSSPPLPMSAEEMRRRGWDAVDVVFATGDAYVDHPSFANALLARLLESEGYRVGVLSQPDWHSAEPWRIFGRPRLAFAVSAGNLDSMLNHYTAARKVRNDDAYSPGGQIGRRPDRASAVYCQRAREAFSGVPILLGGVEASLRRIAHYDYWSDKVRRSVLLDAKADLLIYGMGEHALVEILAQLSAGRPIRELRDVRGTVFRLGASEPVPNGDDVVELPAFETVSTDSHAFVEMTRLAGREVEPANARRLVQKYGREAIVVNPPSLPLAESEMDRLFGFPFTRRPHPSYGNAKIPALEVVRHSIQIVRGCFGGCTFCSIGAHEGRTIQSRSRRSIVEEIERMAAEPDFHGIVSDLGGPTANMYGMNCRRPDKKTPCRRPSCLYPEICPNLSTDHGPLVELMRAARGVPGVKKVLIASGVRMDLALTDASYIRELARHHVGGLLKVAPEHVDPKTLEVMHKPPCECFTAFADVFDRASAQAGLRQHLVPYFLAGHPGCDLAAAIDLAVFLKETGYQPDKVQEFIPLPMDAATCMYHTGIDPATGRSVYVPRSGKERRWQKALMQFFKPENYLDVREALLEAGRSDLIGRGPNCLIGPNPPREAGQKPSRPQGRSKTVGYRPHRQHQGNKRPRRHGE